MSNSIAFVLAVAHGGTMILNRLDFDAEKKIRGVGLDLLADGTRNPGTGELVCRLAQSRRKSHGDGVVIIDGGANIGSFTIPWARFMTSWGRVIAYEPQQWPYYALAGNIALNNCFNAEARQAALTHTPGSISCPDWPPNEPRNFGGMVLGTGDKFVPTVAIDSLDLPRLDILKLDVEGMEIDALHGARRTIERLKPLIIAEHFICGAEHILMELGDDYGLIGIGDDVLCIHKAERNAELIAAVEAVAKQLNMKAA